MAIIADFMLVYLPAPTVSLRPSIAVHAGPVSKFFYNCPDNAFQVQFCPNFLKLFRRLQSKKLSFFFFNLFMQVALSGTSYSLLQRLGAIAVRNFLSCIFFVRNSQIYSEKYTLYLLSVLCSGMEQSFLQLAPLRRW